MFAFLDIERLIKLFLCTISSTTDKSSMETPRKFLGLLTDLDIKYVKYVDVKESRLLCPFMYMANARKRHK